MQMQYIVSYRMIFAEHLAQELRLARSAWSFVSDAERIRGQRGIKVYRAIPRRYAPSAYEHRKMEELLMVARALDITVLDFYV